MVEGEKPGEADGLSAIDVFTGEVTPTPTWHIASIRHVRLPPVTCTLGWPEIVSEGCKSLGLKNLLLMTVLQFAPFSSLVQPAFWQELTSLKVDVLRLSDDSVPLNAAYALGKTIKDRETGKEIALGCNLTVGSGSFNKDSFQYVVHSSRSFGLDRDHIAIGYLQIPSMLPEYSRTSTP